MEKIPTAVTPPCCAMLVQWPEMIQRISKRKKRKKIPGVSTISSFLT